VFKSGFCFFCFWIGFFVDLWRFVLFPLVFAVVCGNWQCRCGLQCIFAAFGDSPPFDFVAAAGGGLLRLVAFKSGFTFFLRFLGSFLVFLYLFCSFWSFGRVWV